MDKFAFDYSTLEKDLEKPKSYRYEDVKDKIVRIAYDIVRFQGPDEDIDSLWKIQTTDDGDVIVAMYEEGEGKIAEASVKSSAWNVVTDSKQNFHIFYKDSPIKIIACSEVGISFVGISSNDIQMFCQDVGQKLNDDQDLRQTLMAELPATQRTELFRQYPELSTK
jgi:hypothetical protein